MMKQYTENPGHTPGTMVKTPAKDRWHSIEKIAEHLGIKQDTVYKWVSRKHKVLFIDASDQIRVGRAQNYLESAHIDQIFTWFEDGVEAENYVHSADITEIQENDFNLNIPLHVEKIIEDNLPTVEQALTDLKQAWFESQAAEEEFKQIPEKFIHD